MSRKDFLTLVLLSSVISAAIVTATLQWPSPPATRAEFSQPSTVSFDTPLSDDEAVNIRVYESLSRGVVNVTSITLEYTWFFEAVPREGVGSGVILDEKGHIMTNYHVIEGAKKLDVTLFDESQYPARVVGADPVNDLALLRIDAPRDKLSPIRLGSSGNLKVGQKVLAIGNPFGLERTLTTGIISSLERRLQTKYGIVDEVIQTDAAINPGNSGGPLLNTSGEMVGINTAIYSRSGESAGIGFAVPAATVKRVLPDLLEHGRVLRAWFGVQGRALTPRLAEALDLPVQKGFLVEVVEPNSSADRAGLHGGQRRAYYGNSRIMIGGDVITEIAGAKVASLADLLSVMEDKRPGDRVSITYYSAGRRVRETIELFARGEGRRFRF